MKELFSFLIKISKEVEKTETREEDGKTITVTSKVSEDVPVKIIIKQPSRKNIEDADLQYSIEMSNCIKKGILTKGMLSKKYSDTGGLLTEDDRKQLLTVYGQLYEFQNELTKAIARTERDPAEEKKIVDKITEVRMLAADLESKYSDVFNNTADTIAQNNVVRWFCLHMAHVKVGEGPIEPMFKGSTIDEKIEHMHLLDETADPVYSKAYRKLAAFMSLWYFSRNATKEDFEKLDNDIETGRFV